MIDTTTTTNHDEDDTSSVSSLFKQSAGRLPSSSSDILQAKAIGNNNNPGLSSGREKLGILSISTTEQRSTIAIGSSTTPKLSMAQLKARKIMSDSILYNEKDGCSPMSSKVKQIQYRLKSPRSLVSPRNIKSPRNLLEKKSSDNNKLHNIKKDVNYYAVLAKIQKVVSSDEPMTLGKILADANRRGLSMDVVTEMYKQERLKANSLKVSQSSNNNKMNVPSQDNKQSSKSNPPPTMNNNNSLRVVTTTVVDESEVEQYLLPSDVASSTIEQQRCHIEIKENVVNKKNVDEKSKKSSDSPLLNNSHTQKIVEPPKEDPIPSCNITSVEEVGQPTVVATDTVSPSSTQSVDNEEFSNSDVSEKFTTSNVEHSCPESPHTQSADKKKFSKSDISEGFTSNAEHSCPELPKVVTDTRSPPTEKELVSPGLNEFQLRQLTQLVEKAEELRDSDLSSTIPVDRRMEMAAGHDDASEEIDAFFSRFSIQTQRDPLVKVKEETHQSEGARNIEADDAHNDVKEINSPNNTSNWSDSERNDVIDVNLHDESDIEKGKDPVKGLSKDIDGFEEHYLPKHLGLWKSPWQRKQHANGGSGTIQPPDRAGGTSSTFSKRHSGSSTSGYLNIDFYSLYEATVMQVEDEDIDRAPWEYRDVGQRFLNEKSLESRNWFGSFKVERNDRVPNPVCRPSSLEISVTKIPADGEWGEDWFTTWKSRRNNPNNLVVFAQDEMRNQSLPKRSLVKKVSTQKVSVEIGMLCTVRVRGGERVSRVHPDFTSSLRLSRWRLKYLKGSMFPTD